MQSGSMQTGLEKLRKLLEFLPRATFGCIIKLVHWWPFSQSTSLGHDCVFGLHPEFHVVQQCVERADHCSGVSAHQSCGVSLELNFQTQSDGHRKSFLLAWESLFRWSSLPSPVSGDSLLCFTSCHCKYVQTSDLWETHLWLWWHISVVLSSTQVRFFLTQPVLDTALVIMMVQAISLTPGRAETAQAPVPNHGASAAWHTFYWVTPKSSDTSSTCQN